ncbi:Transcription factor MYB3R-2 [Hondaea fermentalgiana]|uniref:Transcription factor MYB3R-2 n=1 Tax=Hondaea fermentalgiana TaxID=2315210 RepID=A0A2R5GS76_9STRA|nr:Transcription factor MYB3R-2 [Hondaea fermentalgiana]|eukprot:GBG33445.1 Transcription factor MYB3R-2 [Hondaea fermentalgiana]
MAPAAAAAAAASSTTTPKAAGAPRKTGPASLSPKVQQDKTAASDAHDEGAAAQTLLGVSAGGDTFKQAHEEAPAQTADDSNGAPPAPVAENAGAVAVEGEGDQDNAENGDLAAAVAAAKARQAAIAGSGKKGSGRWTKAEDESLKLAVKLVGARNWKRIASEYLADTRTDVQCLHRWQKVLRPGLVKGPWQPEEDETIRACIRSGITRWSEIATRVPGRIGKQCRERWFNHLDPNIRTDEWTEEEDQLLIEGQSKLGNKWSQIAKIYLPGRPENAVKNRWNAATRRHRTVNAKEMSAKARAAEAAAAAAEAAAAAAIAQVNASGGSAIDALTLAASTMKASATNKRGRKAASDKTGAKAPKKARKETKPRAPRKRAAAGAAKPKPKGKSKAEPSISSLISLCNVALDDKAKGARSTHSKEELEAAVAVAAAAMASGQGADSSSSTLSPRARRGASFSASRPHLTTPASIDTKRSSATKAPKTSSTSAAETPLWKSPLNAVPSSISPNKPPEKDNAMTSLQILSQMVSSSSSSSSSSVGGPTKKGASSRTTRASVKTV